MSIWQYLLFCVLTVVSLMAAGAITVCLIWWLAMRDAKRRC